MNKVYYNSMILIVYVYSKDCDVFFQRKKDTMIYYFLGTSNEPTRLYNRELQQRIDRLHKRGTFNVHLVCPWCKLSRNKG